MFIIKRNKKAFSLRDKIGECPNICLNIDVVDDSPFFVQPFPISQKDKVVMDRQMTRLVYLGILCSRVSFFNVRDRTRSSSFTGFQSLPSFNLLFKCFVNNLHSLQDCYFCF